MDLKIAGKCWKYLQLAFETDLQRGAFGHIFFQLWSHVVYPEKPNGFADQTIPTKNGYFIGGIPHFQTYPFTIITMILHSAFCYCIDLYKHRCTIVAPCTRLYQAPSRKSFFYPSFSSFSRQSLKTWSWRKTSSLGYSEFGVKTWKTWRLCEAKNSTIPRRRCRHFNGSMDCFEKQKLVFTLCMRFQLLFTLRSIPHPASKQPQKKGDPPILMRSTWHKPWLKPWHWIFKKHHWHLHVSVVGWCWMIKNDPAGWHHNGSLYFDKSLNIIANYNNYNYGWDLYIFQNILIMIIQLYHHSILSYIRVNHNDFTGIIVNKGNHPQMVELFRLVKYYTLPRYYVYCVYYISNINDIDNDYPIISQWYIIHILSIGLSMLYIYHYSK